MTTPPITSITDELIAELEAAANAATPGPWNYDGSYVCTMRQEDGTVYVESWNPIADALLTKNVHYIATANPATIKALLANIADLKQQLVAAGITADNCELFRKDAERYQWLRDEALNMDVTAPAIMVVDQAGNPVYRGDPWNSLLCDDDADAAIDAAMRK